MPGGVGSAFSEHYRRGCLHFEVFPGVCQVTRVMAVNTFFKLKHVLRMMRCTECMYSLLWFF